MANVSNLYTDLGVTLETIHIMAVMGYLNLDLVGYFRLFLEWLLLLDGHMFFILYDFS